MTNAYADYYIHLGDLEKVWQIAREGVKLAGKIGAGFSEYWGLVRMAVISRWRGEHEQALAIINEIASLFEDEELRSQYLTNATKELQI